MVDYNRIKEIYQTNFDDLLDNLGKNCKFVFESTVSNVNDRFADPSRPRGVMRPTHQRTGSSDPPSVTNNSETIRCLVEWDPKVNEDLNIRVEEPRSVIKLKTYLTNAHKILRCDYMIPNVDSANHVEVRYRLLKQINPRGLKEDRYIVSYWKQIHDG